uniref:RHS repeat-associated core domain-containing protein n=1 Tax=Virgibacillus pantothenticus TaxID=1473 RepID=UPI001BCD33CD
MTFRTVNIRALYLIFGICFIYHYDEETGLYYLIARYYHPTHGVFLSLDPDPGDDDDILTQNGYTYANNNPVMMVDPDGEWAWVAVNAGFAAYRGYKAFLRKSIYSFSTLKVSSRTKSRCYCPSIYCN